MWNRASMCPEGMAELGPDVWNPEGMKVLGAPVGSTRFVEEVVNKRLEEEAKLWEAIPFVPDLQAAWQILLQCAGPRCHHMLRTLPPSQSEEYAQAHDAGMLRVMDTLLALSGNPQEVEVAHNIASLPMRLGGLGLRSAQRMAPAAYWASWADALHMIDQRLPVVAANVAHKLTVEEELGGCLEELRNAAAHLDRDGFIGRPQWHDLRMGIRPGATHGAEPGEWPHGWQYYASSSSEHSFRKNVVLNQSCAADQAHLRSHSGPGASEALSVCPSKPEFCIEAKKGSFELWSWRDSDCHCRSQKLSANAGSSWTDKAGTELLVLVPDDSKRGQWAPERALARVCREVGATVRCNARLRDMNVVVAAHDDRAIEVLATGLPLFFGAQLAVDITLRCALAADGTAHPGAARVDGAVCTRAREDEETKYSELLRGDRCRLVVVALETGGRWSEEALQFVESLAAIRARDVPPAMFHSGKLAWRWWVRLLSVSCARSFPSSLVALPTALHALGGADGVCP